MPLLLDQACFTRVPLRYGTERCCIELADSRYTRQIVALRNDPSVNQFIHNSPLTETEHEQWLSSQLGRRDALNFVSLVNNKFAGTASLYDIEPLARCQYGRVVMPDDGRRIFAIAIEFLCLSFAFEILQLTQVYCRVVRDNRSVYEFHLRNGWAPDPAYDSQSNLNGSEAVQLGMSMSLNQWESAVQDHRPLLQRLYHANPSLAETADADH